MSRRKKVLTDEQIVQVEALAAYLSIEDIAHYLGVGATTFYEIKNRQPNVSEAYKRGVAKARSFVASKLISFIKEKENTSLKLTAIMFYLRTQAGWSDKQELNVNTKDVTPKQPPSIVNNFLDEPLVNKSENDE